MSPNASRPALGALRHLSGLSNISKKSFRSFATSSFEADDERSSTDERMSDPESDTETLRPAYVGHDGRPTSSKEVAGWYMYAFAAETYVICGIGMFFAIES